MLLLERISMSDFEILIVVLTIIGLVLISNQDQKITFYRFDRHF
ncbi:TPA: hypothetical protein RRN07_002463 [Staphylococcus argenteus]|nr:hypothetical protein [Staphylococcus argenteus]MBE2147446.1 hypothetical protein [Staphylococcus argenteus]MBE2162436.1 hypothetical protein [Staphylococcus argenteus]OMH92189.1 hypothetical protein A4U95_10555 [Staphylococcus argenteus]PSH09491.1 hypothetical protein CKX94_07850 [Staphylococcus argenteus]